MSENKNALKIWVVYDHPTDHPNHFIARLFLNDKPSRNYIATEKIETLRAILKDWGLYMLTRNENDDPIIVETWI